MDEKSNNSIDRVEAKEEASFDELLEASFAPSKRISPGDKIEARVVSLGRDYVFLDLGARTEGLLNRQEVINSEGEVTISEGDQITVFATASQDGAFLCGLRMGVGGTSEHSGDKYQVINALKEAFNSGMPVEGTVKESIDGGFSVTVMGQRAFCPISQIDNKYCDVPSEHLNQTYGFEIIKFEEGGRNIVVSRRRVLEAEAEEKAGKLWKEIAVDNSYDGVVSSIRPYGAFVDIGGIEGLLHVSELSYARVDDPKDLLEVGQKITVSIKEIDLKERRVSLSLKALMADPWQSVLANVKTNQVIQGRVVRIARFGAFVELTPGVEGLVHISEMSSSDKHINSPRDVVSEGQEIAVRILEIDLDRRRISLTMNTQEAQDNWKDGLAQSSAAGDSRESMGTLGDLLKDKLTK
ncbi:MAG: 30S ribosomal protein S1 [Proteobacteria bacterium]|nr:30S ribosomal protein S1 [Pseudomonadota bacterium]